MQILAHKPLHTWVTGGKIYIYTPACSVIHNGASYFLVANSGPANIVDTFNTDTANLYVVVSDDTGMAFVSDHEVEDTDDFEIIPTDEEIEDGLAVKNLFDDSWTSILPGIHYTSIPLAVIDNGIITRHEDVECSYR